MSLSISKNVLFYIELVIVRAMVDVVWYTSYGGYMVCLRMPLKSGTTELQSFRDNERQREREKDREKERRQSPNVEDSG